MDIKEEKDRMRDHAEKRLSEARHRYIQVTEAAEQLAEEIAELEKFLSINTVKG